MRFELLRYQNFYQKSFDAICLLQPTSPFRKASDLKHCYNILKKKKLDAVWTVSEIDNKYHPIKILNADKGNLTYHHKDGPKFVNRQGLNKIFIRNGIAYFFSAKTILKYKSILPRKSGYLIIKRKVVNIDTPQDLLIARKLI
jgi:CMP-N-acetylneuraminic acid synthetase